MKSIEKLINDVSIQSGVDEWQIWTVLIVVLLLAFRGFIK